MERSAGSLCSVCLLTLFLLARLIYGCHSKYTIHVFFSTQGAAESHFPLVYDIAAPVSHQAGLYAFYFAEAGKPQQPIIQLRNQTHALNVDRAATPTLETCL